MPCGSGGAPGAPPRPTNEPMLRQMRGPGAVFVSQETRTHTTGTVSGRCGACNLVGLHLSSISCPRARHELPVCCTVSTPMGPAGPSICTPAAGSRPAPYLSHWNRGRPRGYASWPSGRPCVAGDALGCRPPAGRPRWPGSRPRCRGNVHRVSPHDVRGALAAGGAWAAAAPTTPTAHFRLAAVAAEIMESLPRAVGAHWQLAVQGQLSCITV